MPFGAPGAEKLIVNVDSLWSGGPFSVSVGGVFLWKVCCAILTIVFDYYRITLGVTQQNPNMKPYPVSEAQYSKTQLEV